MHQKTPAPRHHYLGPLLVLLFWFAVLALVVVNQQRIIDWWKLRGYVAPTQIVHLATDDTMTDYARHLFYVNKPMIVAGKNFTQNCPTGAEKTVVLGCYKSADSGIYLYDVTDARLHGVEQVTAAHEMLHAAYARLSKSERAKVDAMLMDYYQHGLTDERVKATISAYKQSEPGDIVNEMHSVFGTEVSKLPAGLETYYKQYFTNRQTVTAYTAAYESEFTAREKQVAAYDAQLQVLKQTIEDNEAQIATKRTALDSQRAELDTLERTQNYTAYSTAAVAYNRAVSAYNNLLVQTKQQIQTYNDLVDRRNATALEENQLLRALSAQSLPTGQ